MTQDERDRFEEWVEETYRRVVVDAGEGTIKRAEAIPIVVEQIANDIANGDLDPPTDLEAIVRRIIERGDDQRRRHHPQDVSYVLDIINGNTILGKDNPWLDSVCVAGNGVRKSWRFVDGEDLLAMAELKVRMAADAAQAAADFMRAVTQIRSYLLRVHGHDALIGDLAP